MAEGWAVKDRDGNIMVATVSPTKRAAKVNWLTVACRRLIPPSASDKTIDLAFCIFAEVKRAALVPVTVEEAPNGR